MTSSVLSPDPLRFTSGTIYDDEWFTLDLSVWMFSGDIIVGTPSISVTRSDGVAVDMTVYGVALANQVVGWKAKGGTAGIDYTFLVNVVTVKRNDTIPLKYYIRPL